MNKNSKKTALIIGAGPAGLTAAYELLKNTDIHPIILEKTEFIGGISRTAVFEGNRIDIGGHRFFTKEEKINKLWNELLPVQGVQSFDDEMIGIEKEIASGGPNPNQVDDVMLIRNRVSRIFYLKKFFDYPISIKLQTFLNMGFLNVLNVGVSFLFSMIKKRKENSLEDFYINKFGKQLYKMFFEDYTQKVWGIHPSEISPDWGAQRVKNLSLIAIVKDVLMKIFCKNYKTNQTSLIEQFMYPKKGPGQLYEKMAQAVQKLGGELRLNSSVLKLNVEDNKVISVELESGESINCDYLFSSMPIKDLIAGIQDVPQNVKNIASQLPYRDFITVGLLVNKLKLKNTTSIKTPHNIIPDCWIYINEKDVKIGRLQIFNNWSPYLLENFDNTVWVGLEYFCNEGDALWNMPREEFIQFAISELVKLNIIDKADVLKAEHIKVEKAYPAYFGSYKDFDIVRCYLDTIDNLYCIGRNGQHRYNNMDHSMMTAVEAVNLVVNNFTDKNLLWNVNTEKEYHEEK